ncbi:glycosyltransferase family 4 protein [Planktomarina temperata]|nr:glycosyltransferase family 4 protein [Planktomarina temperata]
MRILFVHNFYGSSAPSGENLAANAELELLRSAGHDVRLFAKYSDNVRERGAIGAIHAGFVNAWNPKSAGELLEEAKKFQPDIVHVHNTFPLISPSIFWKLSGKFKCVLTLHNYRLLCPAAIPARDGKVCTKCIDGASVLPALRYGCYKNSHLATLPLALNVALHRKIGTWVNRVDGFIALTEFQKRLMTQAGLPEAKVHVKPNFHPGQPFVKPYNLRNDYVIYAGRLSKEKGLITLLKAWKIWGDKAPELRIVGDGPLLSILKNLAQGCRVKFFGKLPQHSAIEQIAGAKLLLLPSEWFEGFPLVLQEAFALGTPVVASDIGPFRELVKEAGAGIVVPPSDPVELQKAISQVLSMKDVLNKFSSNSRRAYEQYYNDTVNLSRLMDIYLEVIK